MRIHIITGTGEGPTPLAAFDAALITAGIANYNLIYLSSIIPANSIIQRAEYIAPADEHGYRLYLVMARQDEYQAGKRAWAGLGWAQDKKSGRGLFAEVHGSDRSQVEGDIYIALKTMIASRSFPCSTIESESEIVGIECRDKPVCALVMAVYQSEGWAR